MRMKFLIFTAVIFLLSSGALADIGQVQGFSIGSLNIVARCGPVGSARGGNMVVVSQSQQVHKPYYSVTARQEEEGVLVQRAATRGCGGVSGVAQGAKIQGVQGQLAKPFGPKVQGQALNVKLGQMAIKKGGVGRTHGMQSFVGGQTQTISTPLVTTTQTQVVGAEQRSSVSGHRGSNGIVVNTVNVEMGQGQSVSGLPHYPR